MEKVKITQKQADALVAAIRGDGKASVLSQHAVDDRDWCNACEGLNLMPLMTLASALVNGYEIEEQIDSVAIFAEKFGRKFS